MGRVTHLIQCKHTANVDFELDADDPPTFVRMRESWRAPDAKIIWVTNAKRFDDVHRAAKATGASLLTATKLFQPRQASDRSRRSLRDSLFSFLA